MNDQLFARRIEEVEESILDLAGWVAQSHKRPSGTDELSRRISRIFGVSFRGPIYSLSLPMQLLDDFRKELSSSCPRQTWIAQTEELHEAVTHRFVSSWTLAKTMTTAYWDILELYGIEIPDAWRFFRETSSRIFSYGILNLGEAYCKYQTAFLLSRALENEPPPRPHWFPWSEREGFLMAGPVMRKLWCRVVLRHRMKDISLAYSLYQAKKVAPEISPILVEEAMEKNLSLLTEERPSDDVDDLIYQVRRTVREISSLPGKKIPEKDPFPSLSASYSTPRSKGGALSELIPEDWTLCLAFKEFLGYVEYRTRYVPVYRIPLSEDDPRHDVMRLLHELLVRRQSILEPFKVRIVSMGPAEQYQIARSFQAMLWGFLYRTPIFDLTGRPCEVGDVASICRWVSTYCPGIHSVMVSGDYSAATDNLHPELSEACLMELCEVLSIPWKYRTLLLSCLTRHVIVDATGIERPQTWGQLMGSPISFPILCIVNLAVTRHVMEQSYGMFIPLDYGAGGIAPLKVNGDDILFPLPPADYVHWQETVTRAGLSPSVGKNYVSRRIAVINSEMYELDPDWDRGKEEIQKIPYVNLGLLKMVQEHGRGDSVSAFVPSNYIGTLRQNLEKAVDGFDAKVADRLVSYALRSNRQLFEKIPPVSWWVAEEYGGLGLPSFREVEIAEHHLKLAAAFTMLDQRLIWSMRHPRQLTELTTFSQMEEEVMKNIYDTLGIPWVREVPMDTDDSLPGSCYIPEILRGYAHFGSGREISGENFLRRWAYVYNRWMQILRKNWVLFHPMNPVKAKLNTGRRWIQRVPKGSSSSSICTESITISEIIRTDVLENQEFIAPYELSHPDE